jgi:hypothetical protein
MNSFFSNSNQNLTLVGRASDGTVTLVPIIYWCDFRTVCVPIDLTHMVADWGRIDADFAVHDAATGRVYMRNGDVFDTLVAFAEASR